LTFDDGSAQCAPVIRALLSAELALWVVVAGVLITLAGAAVTGHRIQRWLWYSVPQIGRRIPPDMFAWGFLIAAGLLLLL